MVEVTRPPGSVPGPVIVVVGAGASGVMTACHLLRSAPAGASVRLIDGRESTGRGIAYGTTDERHLLNVPVARMSVDPDQPAGFFDWLQRRGRRVSVSDFVPRRWFGEYLEATLAAESRTSAAALYRITDAVIAIRPAGARYRVRLAGGLSFVADAVVLAVGEPAAPDTPSRPGTSPTVIGDPWDPWQLHRVAAADRVLLVGSGLTAIDIAISLDRPGRHIVSLSRSGLLPARHAEAPAQGIVAPPLPPPGPLTARGFRELVDASMVAAHRDLGDWRHGVDAIRPVMDTLWARMPAAEQRRFHEDRRWWEVLRHRMPPATAQRIDDMRRAGRLEFAAGAVRDIRSSRRGIRVTTTDRRRIAVDAVIRCTGPAVPERTPNLGNPLLADLVANGLARLNAVGLGVDVTDTGVLRDAVGRPRSGLTVIGGFRRGQVWETTAVPQLRVQARDVAALVLRTCAATAAARQLAGWR